MQQREVERTGAGARWGRGEGGEAARDVELWRAVEARLSEGCSRELAVSLGRLALAEVEAGRPGEALAAALEAAALGRRELAEDPDFFAPCAELLQSLSLCLAAAGQPGNALALAEEAVAMQRALAASERRWPSPGLASALGDLALRLGALGREGEAADRAREALALYQELAEAEPPGRLEELEGGLVQLACLCRDPLQALGVCRRGLEAARELSARGPAGGLLLASALREFSAQLRRCGEGGLALAVARDAVALCSEITLRDPDPAAPLLASSLDVLSMLLREHGQPPDAVGVARSAVELWRGLVARHGGAFSPDLALSLGNLALYLQAAGAPVEALGAALEAAGLFRALEAGLPGSFRSHLDRTRQDLTSLLLDLPPGAPALAARPGAAPRLSPSPR